MGEGATAGALNKKRPRWIHRPSRCPRPPARGLRLAPSKGKGGARAEAQGKDDRRSQELAESHAWTDELRKVLDTAFKNIELYEQERNQRQIDKKAS